MQRRDAFLEDLQETLNNMIEAIEDREIIEPDFGIVREIAEQLKDEIDSLSN